MLHTYDIILCNTDIKNYLFKNKNLTLIKLPSRNWELVRHEQAQALESTFNRRLLLLLYENPPHQQCHLQITCNYSLNWPSHSNLFPSSFFKWSACTVESLLNVVDISWVTNSRILRFLLFTGLNPNFNRTFYCDLFKDLPWEIKDPIGRSELSVFYTNEGI